MRYSKYRAKPTFVDGIRFASKKEARRYRELRLLEKAGEIMGLVTQIKYPLFVNEQKVCVYIADFVYDDFRGGKWVTVVEDTKGMKTPLYRLKCKMFEAQTGTKILET